VPNENVAFLLWEIAPADTHVEEAAVHRVVSGGVASTFQTWVGGVWSDPPLGGLVARTVHVCVPSVTPLYVFGLVHPDSGGSASSVHSNIDAFELVNVNVALRELVEIVESAGVPVSRASGTELSTVHEYVAGVESKNASPLPTAATRSVCGPGSRFV